MDKKYCPYCMNPITPGEPCSSCGLTEGTYTASPHHLPPGTVLVGRYLIGRVLGEGGFGITYIGCDLRLELRVAIKEYYPHDRVNRNNEASLTVTGYTGNVGKGFEAGRERFIQEARVMARMDKTPQIVAVRDFFQENNTAYIVMEYVDGTTFKELVAQKGGKISASELLPLVEPMFSALSAMHALGLIHRDISPDNLMLENGGVRLLDFGCARESDRGVNTMTIVLKHGYSPIEQYQHKGQGPWTDVYSLSATLYYCLTGKTPPQALDRICGEELTPPRQLGADLTPAQEKAILRGMGMRRSQRFPSVEEMHAALYKGVDASVERPEDETPDQSPVRAAEPIREKAAEPPDVVPETIPAGEPDSERSPASEEEPDTADQAKLPSILDFIKARWPVVAGAGAALVLIIALLVWHPWTGSSTVDGPDPTQPGTDSAQGPSQDGLTSSEPAINASSLFSLLKNDAVEEIVIPSTLGFSIDTPVTLTKTLRIEKDAWVGFNGGLTIAEGGRMQVFGNMDSYSLLRTMDGGTILVESGGGVGTHMLWLEREGDLTCAPDGSIDVFGAPSNPTRDTLNAWERSHYLVMGEEELFADAVHVTTEDGFAQHYEGGSPIVIDRDITFTHTYWVHVPVLIPEGVTVDAPCPNPGRDEGNCTLEMCSGTVLINHGTLKGRVALHSPVDDENGQRIDDDPSYLVNFGTMDANLYAELAAVINLGDMTTREVMQSGTLTNVGSVTLDGLLEMRGNWSNNSGTITVARDGALVVYGGTGWNNFGELVVEDGGRFDNYALFNQNGSALKVRSGGALANFGQLWVNEFTTPALIAEAGAAEMSNFGVVVSQNRGMSVADGWSDDTPGQFVTSASGDLSSMGDRVRWVGTESELRAALEDDSCEVVFWNGNGDRNKININGGPLTVTKGLVLQSDDTHPADLNSGGITVTGENAFLISNCTNFHGNGLTVEDGSTVVINYGEPDNLGRLDVSGGGLVCFSTNLVMQNGEVNVSGGGRVIDTGGGRWEDCAVRIDGGSELYSYAGLELIRCDVVNNGSFDNYFGYLYQEGGSFTNNGRAGFTGWHDMVNLSGDVSNHGEMFIGGAQLIGGTLVNEEDGSITLHWEDSPLRVAGRLVNRGRIQAAKGTYVETIEGGVFTGNPASFD